MFCLHSPTEVKYIFIGENVILFILFPMKDMPIFVILFKIAIFDSTNLFCQICLAKHLEADYLKGKQVQCY